VGVLLSAEAFPSLTPPRRRRAGPSLLRLELREPRPARPAEIRPSLAPGQHQNVGQGAVRAEPREQAVAAIAPRPLAMRSVDADPGKGNWPKECEPRRIWRARRRASMSLLPATTSEAEAGEPTISIAQVVGSARPLGGA
jgi:hypothetical protein